MWALIDGKRVCEIREKQFPVAPTLKWVACGQEITTFYTYVNGNFVPPGEFKPVVIPDSVFQLAVKKMIKNLMLYVNGEITKEQLNDRFDAVKDHLKEITSGD